MKALLPVPSVPAAPVARAVTCSASCPFSRTSLQHRRGTSHEGRGGGSHRSYRCGRAPASQLTGRPQHADLSCGVNLVDPCVTTGRELVNQLVSSPTWSKVTTVGRREIQLPDEVTAAQKAALVQKVVNMDAMNVEAADAFKGADVVFCALGTTRKDAGSAEQFKTVDYEYVAKSAQLAKAAGVPHFSLVSAQGANANIWANDLGLFHGLLYAKTKGRAEEAVKAQGFQRTVIWRPGMLDRGAASRPLETMILKIAPASRKIRVADVAKIMMLDAEEAIRKKLKDVKVFEMGQMVRAAEAGTAPES